MAKVTTVVKDPSKPYAVVKAKPTALLETSREVLLVWSQESPRNTDNANTGEAQSPPAATPGSALDSETNDDDTMAGVNP